jgi:hypothetical protein
MPDLPARRTAPLTVTSLPLSAAREQVVALLSHHFASGTLSMDEFEHRVASVYATNDGVALEKLVADLPAAAGAADAVPPEGRLSAVLSHTARHGSMTLPRHLLVRVFMGNVELDLRDATFAPGVSEIEVSATFGNVEITVPSGVRVECTGNALLGSFESRVRDTSASGTASSATIVRVTGRALLSSVDIRG